MYITLQIKQSESACPKRVSFRQHSLRAGYFLPIRDVIDVDEDGAREDEVEVLADVTFPQYDPLSVRAAEANEFSDEN